MKGKMSLAVTDHEGEEIFSHQCSVCGCQYFMLGGTISSKKKKIAIECENCHTSFWLNDILEEFQF